MLKLHSLILNRLNDFPLGSQLEEGVHLFFSMSPLINGRQTAQYTLTEPITVSFYQTPICYDLAFLNAGHMALEEQFYLKLGIQFRSEFYHVVEGIINLADLYNTGVTGYRKWEIADAVISATIIFKEEISSLGS